jgi:hypothetical protein
MVEQLKKDYGIEQVKTTLIVTKLADNKISTALAQTKLGSASPFGAIDILPSTSSDLLIRNIQGTVFGTGFHELKHLKQFADAYRANPEKFAEAIINNLSKKNPSKKEMFDSLRKDYIEECKDEHKRQVLDLVKRLRNGDDALIQEIMEHMQKDPKISKLSKAEWKRSLKTKNDDELMKIALQKAPMPSEKALEKESYNELIADVKRILDKRYGKLTPYKEGTEEYKKGMQYIDAYENYPDPKVDYDAYRANLLEKEAFHFEDLAKKIHDYSSSIWKL